MGWNVEYWTTLKYSTIPLNFKWELRPSLTNIIVDNVFTLFFESMFFHDCIL